MTAQDLLRALRDDTLEESLRLLTERECMLVAAMVQGELIMRYGSRAAVRRAWRARDAEVAP
jgi:hypothetical protein